MKNLLLLISFIFLSFSAHGECKKRPYQDINDISFFYKAADNKTGEDLKSTLNRLVKGHTYYSYTPCVWAILEEADEDPDNKNNILTIYLKRSVPKVCRDRVLRQGQHFEPECHDWWRNEPTNTNSSLFSRANSWNREHLWSKSHGFKKRSQHAYTDAHHIVAADSSINTQRNDNDFDDGGSHNNECSGCRKGIGTWEPPHDVKGDIARMMFYMVVRYEGSDGSATPDLELIKSSNSPRTKFEDGYGHFGNLCVLLEWHLKDQVSDKEVKRNNVIYSWQGNRNPFIDRPEFVEMIWGSSC